MNFSKSLKIVLDPGHVGSNFFDLRKLIGEERYFYEGDFCFFWATLVAEKLKKAGHSVILSRDARLPSKLLSEFEIASRRAQLAEYTDEELLRRFRVPVKFYSDINTSNLVSAALQNEGDLLNRARYINSLKPDLCLSLHLNGDPKQIRTDQNGISGLTNQASDRNFDLFEQIIQNLKSKTSLATFRFDELKEVRQGVFIDESLTLLRNVYVPILLVEGPFQNNYQELDKLFLAQDEFVKSGEGIGRLAELSDGMVEALFFL